tara:strand:+ start:442 stop:936 length:495 start_codon:yes stop_codon:yes gene_type:complete
MVITYKSSNKIVFPVYLLPSNNWSVSDNIVTVDNQIVDDKNMSGETLGIRRLQTPFKSLLPLKLSVDTLVGIFKQKSKNFIDSKGMCFIYEKTIFSKLKYHKITKIDKKIHNSLLFIKEINTPFIIPRPPTQNLKYVGILYLDKFPWMPYNYSETCLKDTRRKI